jgi:hypothetical protein
MDVNELLLDVFDAVEKIYSAMTNRSYVTGHLTYVPPRSAPGEAAKEEIALTITNESGPGIEVKRVWFLTSYNRSVYSQLVDSKMPLRLRKKDRMTYFMTTDEFKPALDKAANKETFAKIVVQDDKERMHVSRINQSTQKKLQ